MKNVRKMLKWKNDNFFPSMLLLSLRIYNFGYDDDVAMFRTIHIYKLYKHLYIHLICLLFLSLVRYIFKLKQSFTFRSYLRIYLSHRFITMIMKRKYTTSFDSFQIVDICTRSAGFLVAKEEDERMMIVE